MMQKALRVFLATLAALCAPVAGHAGLEICNFTGEAKHIALGYKGDKDWTSEGWWRVKSGGCSMIVTGDLTRRYYYYHVASRSGLFAAEDYFFCTAQSVFTIAGDTDCENRGYDRTAFREIDTGKTATEYTLTLRADGRDVRPDQPEADPALNVSNENTVNGEVLRADFAPGAFGKPIEIDALFQGCELENGDAYCSFHSNGHKYRADYEGSTPAHILAALEQMPLLSRVQIRGDQVARKGREAAIVLRYAAPIAEDAPFSDLRRAFQGDWIAVNDKESAITVRGSEIHVRYETEFRTTRFMDFAEHCPGATATGPKLLQSTVDEKEPKCYLVTRADRELELLPVGGGQTLRFRRP